MLAGTTGSIKILIVEDDLVDSMALRRALTESTLDISITWAVTSLAEGVASLEKNKPDVVLLDLGLPDSHGLSAVSALQPWMDEVPIVVLSGLEDEQIPKMGRGQRVRARDVPTPQRVHGNHQRVIVDTVVDTQSARFVAAHEVAGTAA